MANVQVWHRKSAWVNDEVLGTVAAKWGRALLPYRHRRQPILLLDACSTHMGQRFLRACSRWNIWLVFVPARMTWLLQPADTHCFAAFKAYLRKLFEQSILDSRDGAVTVRDIILQLDAAIRRIIQGKRWSPAFDGDGWSFQQRFVRDKIRRTLECSNILAISSALPSLHQFEAISRGGGISHWPFY